MRNDIAAQLLGIRNRILLLKAGQPAVPVIDNPAVDQVVPHTGGIAIVCLPVIDHRRNARDKIIQTAVDQIKIRPAVQRAIVLVLPKMVADLHARAGIGKQLLPERLRYGSGHVDVNIVIGCGIKMRSRAGAADCNRLYIGMLLQRIQNPFRHCASLPSAAPPSWQMPASGVKYGS